MGLTFRKGTVADAENLVCFLERVRAEMTHPEWFYLDPPDLVREMLEDGTMTLWLAEEKHRIAAVFDILQPALKDYNYGYDLNLREDELLQVVHMDTAAVHPDYRGSGLQGQMVRMAEQELSGKGRRILLTTVHPENKYSLNNMLKQGYVIQKQVEKYGSRRYVLRKDIF